MTSSNIQIQPDVNQTEEQEEELIPIVQGQRSEWKVFTSIFSSWNVWPPYVVTFDFSFLLWMRCAVSTCILEKVIGSFQIQSRNRQCSHTFRVQDQKYYFCPEGRFEDSLPAIAACSF